MGLRRQNAGRRGDSTGFLGRLSDNAADNCPISRPSVRRDTSAELFAWGIETWLPAREGPGSPNGTGSSSGSSVGRLAATASLFKPSFASEPIPERRNATISCSASCGGGENSRLTVRLSTPSISASSVTIRPARTTH